MQELCASRSETKIQKKCKLSDLPILNKMYLNPDGSLPKYIKDRPKEIDLEDPTSVTIITQEATLVPTIFTLRHFGTNQLPFTDLLLVALFRYLVMDPAVGTPAPESISKTGFIFLTNIVAALEGFSIQLPSFDGGIAVDDLEPDPLIEALVERYFLNKDDHGPSYPLLCKLSMRGAVCCFAYNLKIFLSFPC